MANHKVLTDKRVAEIADMLRSGISRRSICYDLKLSPNTLRDSLRRCGFHDIAVDFHPWNKRITKAHLEQAIQLIEAGHTQEYAANAIGFTPGSLSKRLSGYQRPPRNRAPEPKERPKEILNDSSLRSRIDMNNNHLQTLRLRP